MVARITAKEAQRLGLDVKAKRTKNRAEAKGPYLSRCKTCGQEFTVEASEDRHVNETHHARYEVLIERNTDASERRVPDV